MQDSTKMEAGVLKKEEGGQSRQRCPRCNGTGLVCGHEPVIGPGNCCVDFANAVCPECKGTGKHRGAQE